MCRCLQAWRFLDFENEFKECLAFESPESLNVYWSIFFTVTNQSNALIITISNRVFAYATYNCRLGLTLYTRSMCSMEYDLGLGEHQIRGTSFGAQRVDRQSYSKWALHNHSYFFFVFISSHLIAA